MGNSRLSTQGGNCCAVVPCVWRIRKSLFYFLVSFVRGEERRVSTSLIPLWLVLRLILAKRGFLFFSLIRSLFSLGNGGECFQELKERMFPICRLNALLKKKTFLCEAQMRVKKRNCGLGQKIICS